MAYARLHPMWGCIGVVVGDSGGRCASVCLRSSALSRRQPARERSERAIPCLRSSAPSRRQPARERSERAIPCLRSSAFPRRQPARERSERAIPCLRSIAHIKKPPLIWDGHFVGCNNSVWPRRSIRLLSLYIPYLYNVH